MSAWDQHPRGLTGEELSKPGRHPLTRLGSMEALTMARMLDGDKDAELLARVEYARQALQTPGKEPA